MKTNQLLRVLSLLAFLLLFAPFYDSCNGYRMMKQVEAIAEPTVDSTAIEADSIIVDSTEIAKIVVDTINNSVEKYEMSFPEKAYDFIDDDESENAFELAEISIDGISRFDYKEFKKGITEEGCGIFFFVLKNFCFVLISIVTFLILIFSFISSKWLHKLSRLNLILLLITLVCLFIEGTFEQINQIKWGYYAFIITNLLIFYYSRFNKIKT